MHGVRLCSAITLPGLEPASGSPDAVIRLGRVRQDDLEPSGPGRSMKAETGRVRIAWETVGAFEILGGRVMIVDPAPGAEEAVVRLFVMGAAMGLLLHQRRMTVLHASVVAIHGRATAIIGEKGWGKSTLTAALIAQGYALVSDDIAAIRMERGEPVAMRGPDQIKLWPNSIKSVGGDPQRHPCLHSLVEKRSMTATRGIQEGSAPLRRIISLAVGERPEIRTLGPAEGLMALLPHWYGARYGVEVIRALGMRDHFMQCSALANATTCQRLQRTNDLADLGTVVELAMEHDRMEQAS
jgi:hypothetical protein